MKKKSTAALVAVLLAGGSVFGMAAPSFADDIQEVASSPVSTSQETSTEIAPTPSTSPDTSVPSEPTPEQNAPDTSAATDKSSDVSNPPIESPASGSPAVAMSIQTPLVDLAFDGWDTWLISSDGTKTGPTGHVSVGADYFPQSYLGSGQVAPTCGQLVQQDHYTGTEKKHAKLVAGPLTWTGNHASDQNSMNVIDWNIVYGGDCPPPIPSAQSCVPTGNWYTEDVAPTQGEDGLNFAGQGTAVDWYHPVTGNLQGLGNQSLTFANVSGYQPSFTIVLNRNGTSGYANLVAEWYHNGGSPSTNGTFAVNSSTLFWTNKIANPAAGSQSSPQPLSFFVLQYPNNQLISLGAHLGSAQGSDTHSALTAISGCVNSAFVPTKPAAIVTHDQNTVKNCETKVNATHHNTTTIEFVWDAQTATYVQGEPVTTPDEDTTSPATEEECPTVVIPPTETPTPVPTETTTPAPVALVSGNAPTEGVLAHTGLDIGLIAVITLALLALGGFLVIVFSPKRRENTK